MGLRMQQVSDSQAVITARVPREKDPVIKLRSNMVCVCMRYMFRESSIILYQILS